MVQVAQISDVLTGLAENYQAIKATLSQALSGWAKPARHISKITCHTHTVHEHRKKKFIASDEMSTGSYKVPHHCHCHPPHPSLLCRCCCHCCCCCHCHCRCCIPLSSLSLSLSCPVVIAIVITVIVMSHHRRHRRPIPSSLPSPSHRCCCCCHRHHPVIVSCHFSAKGHAPRKEGAKMLRFWLSIMRPSLQLAFELR